MSKIVCVTFNPALDLSASLDQMHLGQLNLVAHSNIEPAGKGVNVAHTLAGLGEKATVSGFMGADNPELFHQLFNKHQLPNAFVEVSGANRTNLKLLEADGRVSEVNFPGLQVTAQDIEALDKQLSSLSRDHELFVIAGSLAPGLSALQIKGWIDRLQNLGKKVIFDASGDALEQGIKAKPWLIKPNHHELAMLMGKPMDSIDACRQAARELLEQGIENVVVSLGDKGLIWCDKQRSLHAIPPQVEVLSTVGAGDTVVAALSFAWARNMAMTQALGFASALSALAVTKVGVSAATPQEITAIQSQVQIVDLEHQR